MVNITLSQIVKALQLQLCKNGIETQINTEQRYFDKMGFIGCKYKVIYWLTNKNAEGRKQKIEKEFTKLQDVVKELNNKLKGDD